MDRFWTFVGVGSLLAVALPGLAEYSAAELCRVFARGALAGCVLLIGAWLWDDED